MNLVELFFLLLLIILDRVVWVFFSSGTLSLVCLGPLTNVATAILHDPSLGENLKHCVIMGGNYYGKINLRMLSVKVIIHILR